MWIEADLDVEVFDWIQAGLMRDFDVFVDAVHESEELLKFLLAAAPNEEAIFKVALVEA